LSLLINFRISFLIHKITGWGFDCEYIKSVDQFGEKKYVLTILSLCVHEVGLSLNLFALLWYLSSEFYSVLLVDLIHILIGLYLNI
jgi:hypothetical protein